MSHAYSTFKLQIGEGFSGYYKNVFINISNYCKASLNILCDKLDFKFHTCIRTKTSIGSLSSHSVRGMKP